MKDSCKKLYEEEYTYELSLPIETNFRFEGKPKQLIKFEDHQFIWKNGNDRYFPLVIIPIPNDRISGPPAFEYNWRNSQEIKAVNRFLTMLACRYHIPFRIFWAHRYIFHKGTGEKLKMPRIHCDLIGSLIEIGDKLPESESVQLAMALFREGISSSSVFNAFLSLYRIIELAHHGKKGQIKWVNANFDRAINDWPWASFLPLREKHSNEGEYLYKQCRCAIAHASSRRETRNPDDPKDYFEIQQDLEVMKALAAYLINSGMIARNQK